jgi:hypothetical protein
VAVAAVVTAAAVNRRCEADNPGSALDDAGESAKRGWFGLKRKASNAADSAVDAAVRAKRKAAGGAKDAVKETGWWAAEKAHVSGCLFGCGVGFLRHMRICSPLSSAFKKISFPKPSP